MRLKTINKFVQCVRTKYQRHSIQVIDNKKPQIKTPYNQDGCAYVPSNKGVNILLKNLRKLETRKL